MLADRSSRFGRREAEATAAVESRIMGLDGIRGLAVLAVVLTHLGVYAYLQSVGLLSDNVLPIVHGGTGVYAFFVLSGFLITALLVREHENAGSISLKRFYARRALRIFPLYFLVIFIALILAVTGLANIRWASFPFSFTYTYNFIPRSAYSGLLGHTWTLAVEEHFYLIWPAAFVWGVTRGSRILPAIALAAFCLSIGLRIALAQTPIAGTFFPERWTVVAGGYIAIGAAMALVLARSPVSATWKRLLGSWPVFALGIALFAHSVIIDLEHFQLGTHARTLGICLLIGWIYLNQQSLGVRFLEFAPLRYLGRISYGIYMWQGLFLSTGPARTAGFFWPLQPWLALLLLIVIAPLSYAYFESPFLRWKRQYSYLNVGTTRPSGVAATPSATTP